MSLTQGCYNRKVRPVWGRGGEGRGGGGWGSAVSTFFFSFL
jgi:hypothetical protein